MWHGIFAGSNFCDFFAICKKKSSRKIKLPQIFFRKNLLHRGNYIQKYWFGGEIAIDNSVDNTSSGIRL